MILQIAIFLISLQVPVAADSPPPRLTQKPTTCPSCKFVVKENTNVIDGSVLGLQPGDTICLDAGFTYTKPLRFVNIVGSEEKPIVFTNCGGAAFIAVPEHLIYVVKFENSKHFRIMGQPDGEKYGLTFSGALKIGISIEKLSTDFEIDGIEIFDIGFAGIMAKTDPSCDDASLRGNFIMRNGSIHHNYIHDTGGEGLYIGNSFYSKGMATKCGTRLPHDLENIKIHHNLIRHTAWEAIQLGCAIKGAEIHSNLIEDYGYANVNSQNNGIQIGEGTGGLCYNNFIQSGKGNGIIVLGLGDNVIFNNIITDAGAYGIFCDERYTPGPGFSFINNTIIRPKLDGIRLYADNVKLNTVVNNLVVEPGNFDTYESDQTKRVGADAYLYLLNANVKVNQSNNYFTRESICELERPQVLSLNLQTGISSSPLMIRLAKKSSIIDHGKDVSSFGVNFDFFMNPRSAGKSTDIGAIEY